MRRFLRRVLRLFVVIFALLMVRKVWKALEATAYVRRHPTEDLAQSPWFRELLAVLNEDPSAVLGLHLFNRHAADISVSWLCNAALFDGLHRRTVLLCLDEAACAVLEDFFPNRDFRLIRAEVAGLSGVAFRHMEPAYQLFQAFRANLVAAVLRHSGASVWYLQADTVWTGDLLTAASASDGVLFDRAGPPGTSEHRMVAGGCFFVPRGASPELWESLAGLLGWWYGPDNAYLTFRCATAAQGRCDFLPFATVANWHFFSSHTVDTGEDSAGKLARLASLGLRFVDWERRRCLRPSFDKLRQHQSSRETKVTEQIAAYHRLGAFVDSLPFLGAWLRGLLPMLSYFVYLTL